MADSRETGKDPWKATGIRSEQRPEPNEPPRKDPPTDTKEPARPARTGTRILKIVFLVLGGLVGLVLLAVLTVILLLQTNWGAAKVKDIAVEQANGFLEGAHLEVGRLDGTFLGSLQLYDVNLIRDDGVRMAHIDTVTAAYRLLPLLRKRVHVKDVYLASPTIRAEQRADSTWDLATIVPQDSVSIDTTQTTSPLVIELDQFHLRNGRLQALFYSPGGDSTLVAENLNVRLGEVNLGDQLGVRVDTLYATVLPPVQANGPLHLAMGGTFRDEQLNLRGLRIDSPNSHVRGRGLLAMPAENNDQGRNLDFILEASPLAFSDLRLFAPTLDSAGTVNINMRVRGQQNRIHATVDAVLSDSARLNLVADLTPPDQKPTSYKVNGTLQGFDPSYVTGDPAQAGLVNADLNVDLTGESPEHVNGRAGLTLFDTEYGTYRPDRTVFTADFTDGLGRLNLVSGINGARFELAGTARPFDEVISYDLDGSLTDLNLARFSPGSTQTSDISLKLSLEGRGTNPETADATADLQLLASRINQYRINSGRLQLKVNEGEIDLDTRINLPAGSILAQGRLSLGEELEYRIDRGRLINLDVAALSGDTVDSAVNGSFYIEGRGTDPQAMNLRADVRLNDTFYGIYRLESLRLLSTVRNGRLQTNAGLDLGDAGELRVSLNGRPFDQTPVFNITYGEFRHIDTGALMQDTSQTSDLNGTFSASVRGTDPAVMALDARLNVTSSVINEQRIEVLSLDAGLRRGGLSFDTEARLPAGRLVLTGSARPFDEVISYEIREGRFEGIDVGALSGNQTLATDLNGSIAVRGRGTDPRTLTLDSRLVFDRSTINDAVLNQGGLGAVLTGGTGTLNSQFDFDRGDINLEASGNFNEERPVYQATGSIIDLDLARLMGTDTLDARMSMDMAVSGEGIDPEDMQVDGRFHVREGVYGAVRLDTLFTGFRLADGLLNVDSMTVRSNLLRASAGGRIALFDTTGAQSSDFRMSADIRSLEPVRSLIDADVLSLQKGHFDARVTGPSNRLDVEAGFGMNSLIFNDIKVAGFDARFDGALGPDRMPDAGEFRADLNYLAMGEMDIRSSTLTARFDGDEIIFAGETAIDERRSAELTARLDPRPEARRIELENLGMRIDEDVWRLQQPAAITYGDRFVVDSLRLISGHQSISANGVIDPTGEQDFRLAIDSLRMRGIADLAGFPGLDGSLTTSMTLQGPAASPRLDGRLLMSLLVNDVPAGNLQAVIDYDENRRMNIDADMRNPEGSVLSIDGYIPFDLSLAPAPAPAETDATTGVQVSGNQADGGVQLAVTSTDFDIAFAAPFLDPETIDRLVGSLTVDLDITGAMNAPALDGTLRFTNGLVGSPLLGLAYHDINVDVAFQNNEVVLNQAVMEAGNGTMTATGRVAMPELTLGEFDIDVTLDHFNAIRTDQYQATVSGNVDLSGTTDAPAIGGALRLSDTNIYLPTNSSSSGTEVQLTSEDVRMLEEYFGYKVEASDTTTSEMFNAMALDMTIEMERDTWVRQTSNPEIAVELTGSVEVKKEPDADIQLFRSIEVISQRSYIRQFGRQFDIARGVVTFNGPITEMMLDVQARFEVPSRESPTEPEAVIIMTLDGQLDDLGFELSSEPEMPNTDIVSYIATGQPADKAFKFGGGTSTNENNEGGGGLVAQGGGLAANQLAGIVEGIAGEELGLDVIEIQQDGLRGTTLIAGKYVNPRTYIGIRQPVVFTGSTNTAASQTRTEVAVEYEMFDWMLLRVISGTTTSAVRLNVMGRYAF